MKIYVLSKLDIQHYGFGTKDVVVSRDINEIDEIMKQEYLEKAKAFNITEESAMAPEGSHQCQFVSQCYAYINGFYYWDIFTKEL